MATETCTLIVRVMLCSSMAWIAGWVDVVCMSRYKAFATMMTGNVLNWGKVIAKIATGKSHRWGDLVYYSALIIAYILGLVAHTKLERRLSVWKATAFAPVIALTILLVEVLDQYSDIYPDRWNAVLLAPMFAVAGNISLKGGLQTVTCMATGHVHSVTAWTVQACTGELAQENKKKLCMSLCIIFFLVFGAACGSAASDEVSYPHQCSGENGCQQLQLEGNCCPDDRGVFKECCWSNLGTQRMLLPVGPVLALILVAHDLLFWPAPQPDDDNSVEIELTDQSVRGEVSSQTLQQLDVSPLRAPGMHAPMLAPPLPDLRVPSFAEMRSSLRRSQVRQPVDSRDLMMHADSGALPTRRTLRLPNFVQSRTRPELQPPSATEHS